MKKKFKFLFFSTIAGTSIYRFNKKCKIDGDPKDNHNQLPSNLKSFILEKIPKDFLIKKDLELHNNFFTFNTEHNLPNKKTNECIKTNENCFEKREYFTEDEIIFLNKSKAKEIIEATYNIHSMCLELVDEVVKDDRLMDLFEIPYNLRPLVRDSWEKRENDFLGRFDFLIDRNGSVKLLEYNGDTPTLLIESGRLQNLVFDNIKKNDFKEFILNKEKESFVKQVMDDKSISTSINSENKSLVYEAKKISQEENSQKKISENNYRNYMNGKYFTKGKSFFQSNNISDTLHDLYEKTLSKTISIFIKLGTFKNDKTQEQNTNNFSLNSDSEKLLKEKNIKLIEKSVDALKTNIDFKSFNFLENSIIDFWKRIFRINIPRNILFVSNKDHEEEKQTANYVESLVTNAINELNDEFAKNVKLEHKFNSEKINIKNTDCKNLHFNYDEKERTIHVSDDIKNKFDILWKLYPYEWLVDEEFGKIFEMYERKDKTDIKDKSDLNTEEPLKISLDSNKENVKLDLVNLYNENTNYIKDPSSMNQNSVLLKTHFLEPAWKLIISSKALLPALYMKYPYHKNLIPAYYDNPYEITMRMDSLEFIRNFFSFLLKDTKNVKTWIIKPTYGREGQNIQIVSSKFLRDYANHVIENDIQDLSLFDYNESLKNIIKEKNLNYDFQNPEKNNDLNFDGISNISYLEDIKDPNHKIKTNNNIYQAFSYSEKLDDKFITVGSWTINGVPSAIIVRGSGSEILRDENSYYFPHLIDFDNNIKFYLNTESQKQKKLRKELYGSELFNYRNIFGDFYSKFVFTERRIGGGGGNYSKYFQKSSENSIDKVYVSKGRKFDSIDKRNLHSRAATGSTSSKGSGKG